MNEEISEVTKYYLEGFRYIYGNPDASEPVHTLSSFYQYPISHPNIAGGQAAVSWAVRSRNVCNAPQENNCIC